MERYSLGELGRRSGAKWATARQRPEVRAWMRSGAGAPIAAWVADMDFPVAPSVREALAKAIGSDDLGYGAAASLAALARAFAARLSTRHGLEVDPELVVIASDVVQMLYLCLETLTEPGDGVLVLTPAYPPFFSAVSETHRRLVALDFTLDEVGYQLDKQAVVDLVRSERPRCLLLCNPHNPTGRAFRRDELEMLAGLALEHDLVVLSDEIHADLVLHGAVHLPIASLGPEVAQRCVTLSSASKAFNLAGLHCAQAAFGSRLLLDRFRRVPAAELGGVSSLGVLAALAAYESGDPWLEAVLQVLERNRQLVARWATATPGVEHLPPEATYLAWLDLRSSGLAGDPAETLARSCGVVLSSGPSFGPPGRGHARLNFATSGPVLSEMLTRLGVALRA